VIRVENLTYVYAPRTPLEHTALKGVNLQIRRGEFFALVGATGSGKSTLAQHFNGLLLPTAGRVLVDGKDTRDRKVRRELWRTVGLVFQYPEDQLFEETVYAEVAFGPRNMGLDSRQIMERVRTALEMVGLDYDAVKESPPLLLSGGERRRVALAGILAVAPAVLVLDEPTAGLDPEGRYALLERIKDWQKKRGTTIVLITHSMEDVARLADRMSVLSGGQIWRTGTPREIFRQAGELRETGLEAPAAAELMYLLKNRGVDVRCDVLTIDEAEREIRSVLAGGK